MRAAFRAVDRILRGDATRVASLPDGQIELPLRRVWAVLVLLGISYGFFIGWYAIFNRSAPELRQLLCTMVKIPALFFFTLVVTFPALYVFNALVGSRLTMGSLFRLLSASLAVMFAVLASFGPIAAFFSLTTKSYPFMTVLNVFFCGAAGMLGLSFLLQTLRRLAAASVEPRPPATSTRAPYREPVAPCAEQEGPPAPTTTQPTDGALEPLPAPLPPLLGRRVKLIFYAWIIAFGLVGAQMSWVLRPFIGDPHRPFQWFRGREDHFFAAVWHALGQLLK